MGNDTRTEFFISKDAILSWQNCCGKGGVWPVGFGQIASLLDTKEGKLIHVLCAQWRWSERAAALLALPVNGRDLLRYVQMVLRTRAPNERRAAIGLVDDYQKLRDASHDGATSGKRYWILPWPSGGSAKDKLGVLLSAAKAAGIGLAINRNLTIRVSAWDASPVEPRPSAEEMTRWRKIANILIPPTDLLGQNPERVRSGVETAGNGRDDVETDAYSGEAASSEWTDGIGEDALYESPCVTSALRSVRQHDKEIVHDFLSWPRRGLDVDPKIMEAIWEYCRSNLKQADLATKHGVPQTELSRAYSRLLMLALAARNDTIAAFLARPGGRIDHGDVDLAFFRRIADLVAVGKSECDITIELTGSGATRDMVSWVAASVWEQAEKWWAKKNPGNLLHKALNEVGACWMPSANARRPLRFPKAKMPGPVLGPRGLGYDYLLDRKEHKFMKNYNILGREELQKRIMVETAESLANEKGGDRSARDLDRLITAAENLGMTADEILDLLASAKRQTKWEWVPTGFTAGPALGVTLEALLSSAPVYLSPKDLREWLVRAGLTPAEFAEVAGVKSSILENYDCALPPVVVQRRLMLVMAAIEKALAVVWDDSGTGFQTDANGAVVLDDAGMPKTVSGPSAALGACRDLDIDRRELIERLKKAAAAILTAAVPDLVRQDTAVIKICGAAA